MHQTMIYQLPLYQQPQFCPVAIPHDYMEGYRQQKNSVLRTKEKLSSLVNDSAAKIAQHGATGSSGSSVHDNKRDSNNAKIVASTLISKKFLVRVVVLVVIVAAAASVAIVLACCCW